MHLRSHILYYEHLIIVVILHYIKQKHVPKFIEMEGVKRDVKLQLGERWWTVTLVSQCHRNSRYDIFTSGWSSFVTQNKLKVDDVCIFELIDQIVPVLKVHVFQQKKKPVSLVL